jgi:DNA (cytosine-5)-methyltransferase 1
MPNNRLSRDERAGVELGGVAPFSRQACEAERKGYGVRVAVVDLFAGAGGLGEGFASFGDVTAGVTFEDVMSVEENSAAHSTLLLRAWQRRLRSEGMSLDSWREYVRGQTLQPWRTGIEQQLWEQAELVARLASLGDTSDDLALADLAARQCEGYDARILIGGPPCQAYSIVGRARNRAEAGYRAEEDKRHYLYQSYLAFLCRLRPEIFVIENVKGLVTSNVSGMRVLHNMLRDLSDPGAATGRKGAARYRIHAFGKNIRLDDREACDLGSNLDIHLATEDLGIPQTRHRVILIGIREDIDGTPEMPAMRPRKAVSTVLNDLPKLRSGLSRNDSPDAWVNAVRDQARKVAKMLDRKEPDISRWLRDWHFMFGSDLTSRGGLFVPSEVGHPDVGGVLNHESRAHMPSDLGRYLFCSAWGQLKGYSPKAREFPKGLWPDHDSWSKGHFEDRFKVQVGGQPAYTIMSHIAKDGHYYIHPDTFQCRSLTVREAARIQTFPDDYFFTGNRTQQYVQVGNAVPVMLAREIAVAVAALLIGASSSETREACLPMYESGRTCSPHDSELSLAVGKA